MWARADGLVDGWAVMDGLGLAGRIAGVGQRTARVVLLTDSASRVPVVIQPSGQRAMLSGDNSAFPLLDFIEDPDDLRPGDRVVSFRRWWRLSRRAARGRSCHVARPALAGAVGRRLRAAGISARAAVAPRKKRSPRPVI